MNEVKRPARGNVVDWGGGEIHMLVDRNTLEYITGRVVIVPEDQFDALLEAAHMITRSIGVPL